MHSFEEKGRANALPSSHPPAQNKTKARTVRCAPSFFWFSKNSVADIGQQGDLACALNGDGQLSLMLCASAGNAAGQDLCALADMLSQACGILIIDMIDLLSAKLANLFSLAVRAERLLCAAFARFSFSIHGSLPPYNIR